MSENAGATDQSLYLGASHYNAAEIGALAHLYRGEMYRRRAHPGDFELAIAAYQEAIAAGDEAAANWRGLGLALRQLNREPEANSAFREYLERDPQAEDRALIEGWLR